MPPYARRSTSASGPTRSGGGRRTSCSATARPAGARSAPSAASAASGPSCVGRIDEGELEAPRGEAPQHLGDAAAEDLHPPLVPAGRRVPPQELRHVAVGLDADRPRAAAGERLERERAGARVDVEHLAAPEELAEHVEHRPPDLVAGGPGAHPRRHRQPAAARLPRDDARHAGPSSRRAASARASAGALPAEPSASMKSIASTQAPASSRSAASAAAGCGRGAGPARADHRPPRRRGREPPGRRAAVVAGAHRRAGQEPEQLGRGRPAPQHRYAGQRRAEPRQGRDLPRAPRRRRRVPGSGRSRGPATGRARPAPRAAPRPPGAEAAPSSSGTTHSTEMPRSSAPRRHLRQEPGALLRRHRDRVHREVREPGAGEPRRLLAGLVHLRDGLALQHHLAGQEDGQPRGELVGGARHRLEPLLRRLAGREPEADRAPQHLRGDQRAPARRRAAAPGRAGARSPAPPRARAGPAARADRRRSAARAARSRWPVGTRGCA